MHSILPDKTLCLTIVAHELYTTDEQWRVVRWGWWGGLEGGGGRVGGVERRSCAFYHAEHIIEYRTIRGMKLPHFFYQAMRLLFYAACLLFEGGGVYRIAGNFRGRKLLRILRFCSYLRKFFPWNLRAWRPLARQKWQSAKVFFAKILFFTNSQFSPSKASRYTIFLLTLTVAG